MSNCAAVVVKSRFVYLISETSIDFLDTGFPSEFRGDSMSSLYGIKIAEKEWKQIKISNQQFLEAAPICGMQIPEIESILMFGGKSKQIF